jgi:uncharacterized membrane protein
VEVIVVAFFFGLSAAVIGKIKGSSFFIWLLIGFCLPIFGTVAALLYRNDRAERWRRCETCGKAVKLHDQVCSRCGHDLYFPEPEPTQGRLFEA